MIFALIAQICFQVCVVVSVTHSVHFVVSNLTAEESKKKPEDNYSLKENRVESRTY